MERPRDIYLQLEVLQPRRAGFMGASTERRSLSWVRVAITSIHNIALVQHLEVGFRWPPIEYSEMLLDTSILREKGAA
ncbi:MAG: hypothetical protein ABIH46_07385 [Chloroflexota bacterium]